MRKRLLFFGLGLGILGLLAWTFFLLFEVVEDERQLPPSHDAQVNEYLALDRWLIKEGHAVRVLNEGNLKLLKAAAESTILIQSELFDWDEESLVYLGTWIENGGSLILCLGYSHTYYNDEILGDFLRRFGIRIDTSLLDPEIQSKRDLETPSFGRNMRFIPPNDENAFFLEDEIGAIRLIQLSKGRGQITVTGRPRFMTSVRLDRESNARLSWYLLANDTTGKDNGDILFIRGERETEGIMGRIFQLGNFSIIIISAVILIIVGFWSIIPMFGVVKGIEEKPGKALAERFLAEGRFLKRFGALEYYRKRYFNEIRRRLIKEENLNDEELMQKAAQLLGAEDGGITKIENAAAIGPQNNKEFVSSIVTLKTILERL